MACHAAAHLPRRCFRPRFELGENDEFAGCPQAYFLARETGSVISCSEVGRNAIV
jgi:hypothetical protein